LLFSEISLEGFTRRENKKTLNKTFKIEAPFKDLEKFCIRKNTLFYNSRVTLNELQFLRALNEVEPKTFFMTSIGVLSFEKFNPVENRKNYFYFESEFGLIMIYKNFYKS
jgi:hypothetical protein